MIELSEYQDEWPILFEQEKAFLLEKIGGWFYGAVEHVGSTSVPRLLAKPVIDIMFGVRSLEASKGAIEVLVDNGYCYYPYKIETMHWFCKPTPAVRTHHLHLIPYESPLWMERLKFRNQLRNNPDIARQYGELKQALAVVHANDREAYTQSKWPFIREVLERGDFIICDNG